MCKSGISSRKVDLGFINDPVNEGTHMCLIFTDPKERRDSLLKFLLSGLIGQERVACFSDHLTEQEVIEFLKKNGISYDERKEEEAIILSGASSVYFENGVFDPDRMLRTLEKFYVDAKANGFVAARVCGEMTPQIEKIPGGDRLLEYESRVSMLLRKCPVTAVCQYDANSFDGATVMKVLQVHPSMIVNGQVVQNPFFIKPEDFLAH